LYGGCGEKLKNIMEEKFEYTKAIEELEAMAAKVEDPQTGIGDIDKYMKRSQELIEACRAYLRGAREKLEA
jgi:exonuclease VII small subunit